MRRSNPAVLLVGVFLAIIAFVAVIFCRAGRLSLRQEQVQQDTVVAAVDIPLGVQITGDMVKEESSCGRSQRHSFRRREPGPRP